MSLQIRAAQLKDLGAIEALYREHAQAPEHGFAASHALPRRQFASSRLWFLVNNTFASILPLTSAADHVYVAVGPRQGIQGFIQAETAPAGKHVWQVLNLSVRPDLDRFQTGTALLDHLFNEGLRRGVFRFIVRLSVDDPMTDLFKAAGAFRAAGRAGPAQPRVPGRPSPRSSLVQPPPLRPACHPAAAAGGL